MFKTAWTWTRLAAIGFGVGLPSTKALFQGGMNVWQILVPRYLVATLMIGGVLARRRMGWAGGRACRRGAVLGVAAVLAADYADRRIPVVI